MTDTIRIPNLSDRGNELLAAYWRAQDDFIKAFCAASQIVPPINWRKRSALCTPGFKLAREREAQTRKAFGVARRDLGRHWLASSLGERILLKGAIEAGSGSGSRALLELYGVVSQHASNLN